MGPTSTGVDRASPGEAAAALDLDRLGPSLIDAIASGLGLDKDSLGAIGASALAERIEEKPLRWLRTIDAYLRLVVEAVALSGLHAGFLKGWILKAGVEVGTSGVEVQGALKILEMRRSDPRLKLLKAALSLVKGSVAGTVR